MTALAAFTFLRPLVLLALPLLPALWLLLRRRRADARRPRTSRPTSSRRSPSAARPRPPHAPDLLIPAAMLMALAAAGPAWRPAPSPFVTETAPARHRPRPLAQHDRAPTSPPSRLERAKQKIRDLIALRAGGRVGLVAYAGTAHLVMPLTDDPTVLLPFLEALDPAIMPDPGRTASEALALAETPARPRGTAGSILFVTDGIDPARHRRLPRGGSARVAHRRPRAAAPRSPTGPAAPTSPPSPHHRRRRRPRRPARPRLQPRPGRRREGRLQDDGWLLACPPALLVLLWFRRGTTLRWGAMLLGALPARPHGARAEAGDILADWFWTPDQRAAASTRRTATRGRGGLRRPGWRAAALFRAGSTRRPPTSSPRSRPPSRSTTAASRWSAAATTRAPRPPSRRPCSSTRQRGGAATTSTVTSASSPT